MEARQLRMRRYHLDGLPPIVLPDGCGFRTYRPGDEEIWAGIMNTGIGSGWDVKTVIERLTSRPQFIPEGLFFVTLNNEPVGSACAWRSSPDEWKTGIVHMVCVAPQARGRNLGYLVTLRVLHFFCDNHFREAYMDTDDFRIPAIKAYLRLGFEPFYRNLTHFHRWRCVMGQLRGSG